MAVQHSVARRNDRADAGWNTIGASPLLKFYTGAPPATCADADAGTVLCSITLPANPVTDASGGAKSMAGTWSGTASAGGTVGHYRIYDSSGTTCHEQGTVTATGGGGDMTVANTSVGAGNVLQVTSYTQTEGNA